MKNRFQHPGRRSKLALPIATIVSLSAGLFVAPSYAQGGSLEEIVVTANRREQVLQDVPISITAFNSEDLVSRSVQNIENLDIILPNVMIRGGGTTGPTNSEFTMRGVPGIARYLDGVAQTDGAGALSNIVEIERIEVLKGPQGTLFGKNAMGGAISLVSKAPAEEFGARVDLTAGNFGQKQIGVNVDIPLSDNFLTKVSYWGNQKDGYVQSGNANIMHGDERDTVFRFDGLWHASDDVDVRFDITQTKRNPRHPNADVLYDVVETQAFVQQYNAAGFVFTDASDAFGQIEQYRNTSTFAGPGWDLSSTSMNLTVNWDINDTLALRSIIGGRSNDSAALADLDASRYQFFEIFSASQTDEASVEFQLSSQGEKLDWVLGLYWNEVDQLSRRFDWQYIDAGVYPGGPLIGQPFRQRNEVTEQNRSDSSIFFEATYDLNERMRLIAGARYSEEEFDGGAWEASDPLPTWPNTSHSFNKGAQTSDSTAKFDAFTPRLSFQYDWTDDIMTYATYSEGFNGGGVNTQPVAGQFIAYDGERLNQFEIGFRSQLFDNSLRLNMAYFDGVWEDIQIGEALVPGAITTRNGGEAEISGFELDIAWAVNESFSLNFNYGLLDTQYTDVGNTTTIALGSSFSFAPENQFTIGAQYDWDTDSANMSFRTDYGWTDEYVTIQDIRLQKMQPAFGLLGARLSYTPIGDDWNLAVWGRNLTNQWYQQGGFGAFLGGVDQGVVARPREVGFTLGLEF